MDLSIAFVDSTGKINFSGDGVLATSYQAILASKGKFSLGKQKFKTSDKIPLAPTFFLKDGIFVLDHNFQLQKIVPTDDWGDSKFDDLAEEILNKDCELVIENNCLIRIVRVARIQVLCFGNRLVETQQNLKKECRVRYRGFKAISEKVKVGESFYSGALRGIKEELGLNAENLVFQKVSIVELAGSSYPELMCKYQFFDYVWEMPVEYFKPEGYIADENDTITYFQWEIMI